jgi:hypothetical protein
MQIQRCMLLLRLVVIVATTVMTVVALVVGVTIFLGAAWLAVAAPVLFVILVVGAFAAAWRRLRSRASPGAPPSPSARF